MLSLVKRLATFVVASGRGFFKTRLHHRGAFGSSSEYFLELLALRFREVPL
jgi:hypothetical protein